MRWDELLGDLGGQLDSFEAQEFDGEVADRTRAEWGRVTLRGRLGGAIGRDLVVDCGPAPVALRLVSLGYDWILGNGTAGRELLIPLDAVRSVRGLGSRTVSAEAAPALDARLDLRVVLRRLGRDRATCRFATGERTHVGRVDRVGRDFVQVRVEGAERQAEPELVTVALAALSLVSRHVAPGEGAGV